MMTQEEFDKGLEWVVEMTKRVVNKSNTKDYFDTIFIMSEDTHGEREIKINTLFSESDEDEAGVELSELVYEFAQNWKATNPPIAVFVATMRSGSDGIVVSGCTETRLSGNARLVTQLDNQGFLKVVSVEKPGSSNKSDVELSIRFFEGYQHKGK